MAWGYRKYHNFYGDYDGGYNSDEEDIRFYRPDGSIEGKSKKWCRDQGFFLIEEDLWSGKWYYDHFPNAKKEQEEERKRKREALPSRTGKQILAKIRAEKRSELLDEIYSGIGFPVRIAEARRELQKLEALDFKFKCGIKGCQQRFETDSALQFHEKTQTGKGHDAYRMKHGIAFEGCQPTNAGKEAMSSFSAKEIKAMEAICRGGPAAISRATLAANKVAASTKRKAAKRAKTEDSKSQRDIRSFFQSSNAAKPQSDIRSFFPVRKTPT